MTRPMPSSAAPRPRSAERMIVFTDAVVAIAMTLLVLPLMESVAEAAADHQTAAEWLDIHAGQLVSFLISFTVIAGFWRAHHTLFERVHRMPVR